MSRLLTHEKFLDRLKGTGILKYIEIVGEYNGGEQKIKCVCNVCNHTFYSTPVILYKSTYGCPECSNKYFPNKALTHNVFIDRLSKMGTLEKITIMGEYVSLNKKILVRCNKCKHEWYTTPKSILTGTGCPVCAGKVIVLGFNDMKTTRPDMVPLLKYKDDAIKYTAYSGKSVFWICPHCNKEYSKKILNVSNNGLYCHCISDGVSQPNKFMFQILTHLGVNFEPEKRFDWSNKKTYDFYVPSNSDNDIIIEMHGSFHYRKLKGVFDGLLEKTQVNDVYKRDLAIMNGVKNYIEINCDSSDFEYIRKSILSSDLVQLLELSKIDLQKCYADSLKSLVLRSANLWNDGIHSPKTISDIIKINVGTCVDYLLKATSIGLCDYSKEESLRVGYMERTKRHMNKMKNNIYEGVV